MRRTFPCSYNYLNKIWDYGENGIVQSIPIVPHENIVRTRSTGVESDN